MTRELLGLPEVAGMYQTAEHVLGYDLQEIVMEGPIEVLSQTVHAQPALLIAGLAAVEKLRVETPGVLGDVRAVAGVSLGEYSALVHAGALSFADAMRVVKARATAMHEAGTAQAGTMLTVVGVEEEVLQKHCLDIAADTGHTLVVANHLFSKGSAVAGTPEAVAQVQKLFRRQRGVITKPLQVSGAFHTSMMAPGCGAVQEALDAATVRDPHVPVVSNTTARPMVDAAEIKRNLVRQIVEPVQWQQSVQCLIHELGIRRYYDMGPRSTIKTMLKKSSVAAWEACTSVEV